MSHKWDLYMKSTDTFQRFLFKDLHIRGEWVRLQKSFQEATNNCNYPDVINTLLGETIAASVLLTGTLKFAGKLSIHARSKKGPVSLLMAEASHERSFRGIVNYQGDIDTNSDLKTLLADAQLAITIDPDKGARYQGIVALEGSTLSECLIHYFERSEQLQTHLFLGCDKTGCYGLMLQKLPGHQAENSTEDTDGWNRIVQLARTLSLKEFEQTTNETLLLRLSHEEIIVSYPEETVRFTCSCSQERVSSSIKSLGKEESLSILEHESEISVDCQFCGAHYSFDRQAINNLFNLGNIH